MNNRDTDIVMFIRMNNLESLLILTAGEEQTDDNRIFLFGPLGLLRIYVISRRKRNTPHNCTVMTKPIIYTNKT